MARLLVGSRSHAACVVLEADDCEIYGLVIEDAAEDEITALKESGYYLPIHPLP